MKKNIGQIDKWVRIALGVILLLLIIVVQTGWRWLGLLGIILLATAFLNFCPLYALFGLSSNKAKGKDNTK
jgi:hypothetical protein